ncbi:MAG: hypothetical protein U0872_14165 [Planctomycetaceae bacterium]
MKNVILAVVATASVITKRVFNVVVDGAYLTPIEVTPDVTSTTIQVPEGKAFSFSTDVFGVSGDKATSATFSGAVPAPPPVVVPPQADSSPSASIAADAPQAADQSGAQAKDASAAGGTTV